MRSSRTLSSVCSRSRTPRWAVARATPAPQLRQFLIQQRGVQKGLSRVGLPRIALHDIPGGKGLEDLFLGSESQLDRVPRVRNLTAQNKPGHTPRGVSLLVIGIEVHAIRTIPPTNKGDRFLGGPLESGDGVGFCGRVEVPREERGFAALRRPPKGQARPPRAARLGDRQRGVASLVELVQPGSAQVVLPGPLDPVPPVPVQHAITDLRHRSAHALLSCASSAFVQAKSDPPSEVHPCPWLSMRASHAPDQTAPVLARPSQRSGVFRLRRARRALSGKHLGGLRHLAVVLLPASFTSPHSLMVP